MAGLRQVLAGGAWLGAGSALQAVIAFLANLVLVRVLMPEDFGRFAVVQAGAGLMLSVLSLRVNSAIMRIPEAELTREVRERLFSVLTIESAAAFAAMTAWGWLSGMGRPMDVALMAAMVLCHWTGCNRAFFERHMNYRPLALIETATSMAAHGLAVALALAGAGAATIYARELFVAIMGLAALAMVGGLSWYRLRWPSVAEWRAVLRDLRAVWLDAMLENVHQRIVILLVNGLAGLQAAGLFFQAQRLAIVPHQFLMPLVGRVAATWFGRIEDSGARLAGRTRLVGLLAPLLVVAALVAWVFADPVVPWLFGEAWAPVAPLLRALVGVIVFMSLFEALRSYAVASKRVRLLLLARLGQFAGLLLPLAPTLWGPPPAMTQLGWALSASFAAAFATLWLALARHERS